MVDNSGIDEISCPTSRFCGASDYLGRVLTLTGTHWSAPTPVARGAHIYTISCATKTSCAAADSETGKVFAFDGADLGRSVAG